MIFLLSLFSQRALCEGWQLKEGTVVETVQTKLEEQEKLSREPVKREVVDSAKTEGENLESNYGNGYQVIS